MAPVIGTAGWAISAETKGSFPSEGTALGRYAARFRGVEINSSFHRPHRPSTWQRWAESVPPDFRFSVKLPKTITHQRKLIDCADSIAEFLGSTCGLGDKLAVILVQLPPSLSFCRSIAKDFFVLLRAQSEAAIACEPRHASWFEEEAEALLADMGVARVAADPALAPDAGRPGGSQLIRYWRLHGSPHRYRSSYDDPRLQDYAARIGKSGEGSDAWCIFDNTASGSATGNALRLIALLDQRRR